MSTTEAASALQGSFAPIRPGSLVASVHDQIRGAILGGRLRPGEYVRDSVLAAQMEVSRAPVREALRLLQQSGLVEKSSNKPYRVRVYEAEDLQELAVLRIAIETTAARLVVARRADLTEVRAAMDQVRAAWERRSTPEIDAADWRFHRAVVDACGIGRLQSKYSELIDQIILAWQLHAQDTPRGAHNSVGRHAELLAGLEECSARHDPWPIQQQLIEHIRSGMGCEDLVI